MTRAGRRWSREERSYLLSRWGIDTPEEIAQALGRPVGGVIMRAYRHERVGTPARGLLTLSEVCRRMGYCPPTVLRAAARVGLQLRHPPSTHQEHGRSSRYGIDEEALPRLAAALEAGFGGHAWRVLRKN